MATYTIRTAAALALVQEAAEAGIIARFVRQDGEFFILQTREEGQRTYSDVFDSSDWEDVASTLRGMINSAKTKAEEKPEMPEQLSEGIKNMEKSLTLMEIKQEDLKAGSLSDGYVVRHGNVNGLYLNENKNPTSIAYAKVWANPDDAIRVAHLVRNGAGVQGRTYLLSVCLTEDIASMKHSLSVIHKNMAKMYKI